MIFKDNCGERCGFHRHVLDYFWTCVSGGRARQYVHDGSVVEFTYQPGETRHETYGHGEYKVHDLENLGRSGSVQGGPTLIDELARVFQRTMPLFATQEGQAP